MRRAVQGLLRAGSGGTAGVVTPEILEVEPLRGRGRCERCHGAQHEARLQRRQELPTGRDGTEGGARRLTREGTEALAAEIAIFAGCFNRHADLPRQTVVSPPDRGHCGHVATGVQPPGEGKSRKERLLPFPAKVLQIR